MTKISKQAVASLSHIINPYGINPGNSRTENILPANNTSLLNLAFPRSYKEEVNQSRWFYRYDPIASIVINRMVDIGITNLRNSRKNTDKKELMFYNGIRHKFKRVLKDIALEYLVSGMAIPDFGTDKIMGNRINQDLGRTRFYIPEPLWLRNTDNIELKRRPANIGRDVYLKVSSEEKVFIETGGKLPDGTYDRELYRQVIQDFPDYVRKIKSGVERIKLDLNAILRKPLVNSDYPQPYLVPALSALKHKLKIKEMDYSIANRALESIRHVRVGDKDFPVTEGDDTIDTLKKEMEGRYSGVPGGYYSNEFVYTLYTNHTVNIEWVYPPTEALLSEQKYEEPNADIFLALGFSRMLLVGESLKSNASNASVAVLGPLAAVEEMRETILLWIEDVYIKLAELNGFKNYPLPTFSPISTSSAHEFLQWGVEAMDRGALSNDTIARLFGTDFALEQEQIKYEAEVTNNRPTPYDLKVKEVDIKEKTANVAPQNTSENTSEPGEE